MRNGHKSTYIASLSIIIFTFLPAAGIIFGETTPAEQTVQDKLHSTVELSAIKMGAPLKEAIEHVQNCFEPPLPIVVDWDELATVGIGPTDRASSRGWIKTTAKEALQAILFTASRNKEALLDYIVKDNQIIITHNPYGLLRKTYTLTEQQKIDISGKPLTDPRITEWIDIQLASVPNLDTGDHLYPIQKRHVKDGQITIYQTPENHEKIATAISCLKPADFRQIAIEARLILINNRFCEDIGIDIDQNGINKSSELNIPVISVPWTVITGPANSDKIKNALKQIPIDQMDFPVNNAVTTDDLQASFIIRASQTHRNVKTITSPKVMVLNGESAVMNIPKYYPYIDTDDWERKIETGMRMTFIATIDPDDNRQILLKGRILFSDRIDENESDSKEKDIPIIQVCDIPVHTKIKDQQTALFVSQKLHPMTIPAYPPSVKPSARSISDYEITSDHRLFVLIKASIVDHTESDLIAQPSCQSD